MVYSHVGDLVKTNEDPQAPVCVSLEEVMLIERKKTVKGCETCDTVSVFQNTCNSDGDEECTLVSGEGGRQGPRGRWLVGQRCSRQSGPGGGLMADELVLRAPGSGDRGAPPAGGQESGAQTGDGRAWIGKNPEAAQRSQRRQAAQDWGGKVESGLGPAVRPAGLGFAEMLRGLGSHSEELNTAPCGHSAPLCSPHVLS